MRNLMNKKGVAEVVGVVLLVMLTTTAAVVIAGYINEMLYDSGVQLAEGIDCLDYQTSLALQIERACYDAEKGEVQVEVDRELSNLEVPLLDFVIYSESGSSSFSCGSSCGNCQILGTGSKIYYFDMENVQEQESVTLHIGECVLDEQTIREC